MGATCALAAGACLALCLDAARAATPGEPAAGDLPAIWAAAADHAAPAGDPASAPDAAPAADAAPQPPVPRKNYALPAAEIVGFDFLLNQYNRHFAADAD
ncbi:MAG: hypothetical protein ACREX7_10180, partial [Casimicrobiaceae bacterium]